MNIKRISLGVAVASLLFGGYFSAKWSVKAAEPQLSVFIESVVVEPVPPDPSTEFSPSAKLEEFSTAAQFVPSIDRVAPLSEIEELLTSVEATLGEVGDASAYIASAIARARNADDDKAARGALSALPENVLVMMLSIKAAREVRDVDDDALLNIVTGDDSDQALARIALVTFRELQRLLNEGTQEEISLFLETHGNDVAIASKEADELIDLLSTEIDALKDKVEHDRVLVRCTVHNLGLRPTSILGDAYLAIRRDGPSNISVPLRVFGRSFGATSVADGGVVTIDFESVLENSVSSESEVARRVGLLFEAGSNQCAVAVQEMNGVIHWSPQIYLGEPVDSPSRKRLLESATAFDRWE